jgi:hypothetical protein
MRASFVETTAIASDRKLQRNGSFEDQNHQAFPGETIFKN